MKDDKAKDTEKAGETAPLKDSSGKPSADQAAKEVGADQVQASVDEDNDKGFHGVKTDPTPDEHYSVAGVLAGLPTPETDAEAAALADRSLANNLPVMPPRAKPVKAPSGKSARR